MQATRKATVRFRERSELLDFLLEVAAATSSTLDLDQLLPNVAEIVQKVLPYDLFAILLYNERRQDLRIRYAVGHREEVIRNVSIALGEGITGTAAARREPVLVGDVRADSRYLNTVDAVRTELAVPMTARGKLVGVIDLQSTRVNAYTEYDRALLRLIAARVGIAIDNARLYRRVDRQNRTLKTLANISREFSSILDLNDLLGKIASTVRELINYDAFSILYVDPEARALRHLFSLRYDQRVNIDNVPLGKGITGAAAESREVVRVHDTAKDPRYIASHPDIRSEVAVPLILQDRIVGVMDLESEPHRLLHRRACSHPGPARSAGRQQRRERPPLPGTRHARTPHGGRSPGGARSAARPAARRLPGDRRPRYRRSFAARARNLRRYLRYFRAARRPVRHRLRRRERKRRGRRSLRQPGQRPAPHPRPPPPPARRADGGLERGAGRAQGRSALCHPVRAPLEPGRAGVRHRQCGRAAAHDLPRRRDPQGPDRGRAPRPAGCSGIRGSHFSGSARATPWCFIRTASPTT